MKQYLLIIALFALLQISNAEVSESDTLWVKEIGNEVKTVKFSPDGEYIYAAAIGRKPMKLSTATGEILQEYEGLTYVYVNERSNLDISKDGKLLYSGDEGNTMYIWDTETGVKIDSLQTHYEAKEEPYYKSISVSGQYIAALVAYKILENGNLVYTSKTHIWDVITRKEIKELPSYDGHKIKFSEDGKYICYVKSTGPALLNIDTWEIYAEFLGHTGFVKDIAFSEDGSLLASGDMDGKIKIWDTKKKELVKEMGDNYEVYSVSFIENDKIVGGCGYFKNRYVKIFDINTEKLLGKIKTDLQFDIDISKEKSLSIVASAYNLLLFDYLKLITSIKTDTPEKNITITPNPTNNGITIKFNLTEPSDTKIEILDINSNQISLLYNGLLETGNQEFNWLSSGVPTGVYFCRIASKNQTKTYKIILEK